MAEKKKANPRFQKEAMELVYFVRDIGISYSCPWLFENPVSMISSYYRKPDYTFSPNEYGAYLPEDDVSPDADGIIPPRDRYTKRTCIWSGNGFVMPEKKPINRPSAMRAPSWEPMNGTCVMIQTSTRSTGIQRSKNPEIPSTPPPEAGLTRTLPRWTQHQRFGPSSMNSWPDG